MAALETRLNGQNQKCPPSRPWCTVWCKPCKVCRVLCHQIWQLPLPPIIWKAQSPLVVQGQGLFYLRALGIVQLAVAQAQAKADIRWGKVSIIDQSTTPSPLAQVWSLSLSVRVLVKLELFLPIGQGPPETISGTPGYLTLLAKKLGRFGSQGLMTLPPTEGGTKKNDLMYFYPKCKVLPVIMSLMS